MNYNLNFIPNDGIILSSNYEENIFKYKPYIS